MERIECIACKELRLQTAFTEGEWDKTRVNTTEQWKCRECMNRSEIGILKCNGCNQHLLRDTTFNKWLQGRKSIHKLPSARCNTCYDKDEKAKKDIARATTSMVMKTQTQATVSPSPQATQVNISCPQCRGQRSIDMAKLWQADGRHRFVNQNCIECKTKLRFGTWFRCKDHKSEAIECSGILKKPAAMHVELFNCDTSREFQSVQNHMQIRRDADDRPPSEHQSKRRR